MFNLFKKKEEKVVKLSNLDPEFWNNKWPKAPIIYSGRTLKTANDKIGIDVKTFLTTNDEVLQAIVKKYGLKKATPNVTVLAVQKWVVRFLTYKGDDDTNKCPEFWQFPFETISSKVGDCEDGAILIAALCLNAGIPAFRIKVAAGYVQPEPTAPQGGHAYCIYLAEDDNWKIIDWCYYEDSMLPVDKKPLAKDGGQKNAYKDVWFTFNSEFSWNQTALTVGNRIAKDSTLPETAMQLDAILKDVDKKYKAKK